MKPTLRLLHTSDLHLESMEDGDCRNFTSLLTAVRQTKADLVIIAGDLFDSQRVKEDLIHYVAGGLGSLEVPVVILPGNHDCLTAGSAYNRSACWETCSNIRILRSAEGETIRFPDRGATIWGKALTSYDAEIVPLEGLPRPVENENWHIAIAHGLYIGHELNYSKSYQITRQEIVESGWDYIALGHVPVFHLLCEDPVLACYSGSPQNSGGFLLVELSEETGIGLSRISVSNSFPEEN